MSVLIEMLRDLDRRGKSPLMDSSLVSAIETVPEAATGSPKRSGAVRLILALGASTLLGAATWWLFWPSAPGNSHSASTAALTRNEPMQPLAAPAPAPLPAPAPAPAHASMPAPASTTVAADVPAAPVASATKAAIVASGASQSVPAKGKDASGKAQRAAAAPSAPTQVAQATQLAKAQASELVGTSGDSQAKPNGQSGSEPSAAADSFVRYSGNSGHAQADLARAYELAQRGRDVEAIELLQHTVHDWPQHAESRSALATLLNERGLPKEALAVLLEGAAIDPAHFALTAARMQIELGSPADALSTLALVPQPQRNAEYHGIAAAMAQRAGRHDMAIEEFRSALVAGKPRSIWLVGLGASLEQVGQKAEALKAYRQAQALGDVSSATSEFLRQRIGALSESRSASLEATQGPPPVATHP